jgi:hypothetical protein
MKKIVLGLLVLVFAAPSFATIYTINSGYFGVKTIEHEDTLIMTGGGGVFFNRQRLQFLIHQ